MSTKELLRALTAVTQSYTEFEATRKRLRRAECKIRDLTVEIRHMADSIDQFRLEKPDGVRKFTAVLADPPEYELVSPTSPENPATH